MISLIDKNLKNTTNDLAKQKQTQRPKTKQNKT